MLGNGIYNYSEAARLTGLKPSRVREWFRESKAKIGRRPVFQGDYEPVDGDYAISFLDLIGLYVAGQLRNHGLSLQKVRRLHAKMALSLDTKHPFGKREILTDGVDIFARSADADGREELVDILRDQRVFPAILLPFLKSIDYDEANELAKRWRIADQVVIDPAICFGKPIVESVGVSTTILFRAYRANGRDADVVAYWYGVETKDVVAAVNFEAGLAA